MAKDDTPLERLKRTFIDANGSIHRNDWKLSTSTTASKKQSDEVNSIHKAITEGGKSLNKPEVQRLNQAIKRQSSSLDEPGNPRTTTNPNMPIRGLEHWELIRMGLMKARALKSAKAGRKTKNITGPYQQRLDQANQSRTTQSNHLCIKGQTGAAHPIKNRGHQHVAHGWAIKPGAALDSRMPQTMRSWQQVDDVEAQGTPWSLGIPCNLIS